jgi:hypothetical protein
VTTRIWRAGTQLIAVDGDTYARIDASGGLVERYYRLLRSSDKEDLFTTEIEVKGDVLCERTTHLCCGAEWTETVSEAILLDGLKPADDARTVAIVAAALTSDAATRAEEAERREREADARIAAIDGATAQHGLGADFEDAQKWLVHRIRAYEDQRSAALLRTLVAIAGARPPAPVIQAYVRGCLLAAFAPGEPPPPLPDGEPTDAGPLAEELAARARELDVEAGFQGWADASETARRLREAARAVAQAARLAGYTKPADPSP